MTLLVSLTILGIYGTVRFLLGDRAISNLLVPLPAAIAALVTAVVSFSSYVWAPQARMRFVAFGNYLLLSATTGMLVAMTGGVRSPYVALWMLLTIFSGLFGVTALGIMAAAVNVELAYELLANSALLTRDVAVVTILALEAPIVASYIIWRQRNGPSKQSRVLDAMAKQLSQVANKSEVVINAITEGVIAIDGQGIIQLINPAAQEILGWTKQDALGLDHKLVIKLIGLNGQELPPEASPIQQVLYSGKALVNNDLALMTQSKKKILISLVVSPVGQSEGTTAAGAIAVIRDITSEKAEERQKAEFISTASHEMRTPVAAIEGYLGLALNPSTAAIDEKAHTYLLKAQEATQHLGTLFQDLLTVSRAEDNRLTPKPTVVDIVSFLREVTDGLRQKAQDKGLFLYFKPTAGNGQAEPNSTRSIAPLFYSYVDNGHLREILNNLVDNAIKYTKQGSVAVDIRGDLNTITVSIADSGIGIPPEDVPHLFQKFYRIDNSDTREIGGTGLGLYICRRLIEANSGHIWVESILHERASELLRSEPTQVQHGTASPLGMQAIPAPAVPVAQAMQSAQQS
jgi:PAS domain S-box-containing protein